MTEAAAVPSGATIATDLFASSGALENNAFAWSKDARSLSGLGGWLRGALSFYVFCEMAAIFMVGALLWVFWTWSSPGGQEDPRAALIALVVGAMAQVSPYVFVGAFIICLLVYLRFVYRAMRNLHASRAAGLSVSPGWAVGWSFIPFANLVMVFRVMREIWTSSADPRRARLASPALLGWWWGLWIAAGVSSRISEAMLSPVEEIWDPAAVFSAYLPGAGLGMVSSAMALASTLCLLSIVKQIVSAQDRLEEEARAPS